jgi:hypothetical protein
VGPVENCLGQIGVPNQVFRIAQLAGEVDCIAGLFFHAGTEAECERPVRLLNVFPRGKFLRSLRAKPGRLLSSMLRISRSCAFCPGFCSTMPTILVLKEKLAWNYVASFAFIMLAVVFAFGFKATPTP